MTTYYFEQTIEFSASGTVSFSVEASSREAARSALEEWIQGNSDEVCSKAERRAEGWLNWESDGSLVGLDDEDEADFELGDLEALSKDAYRIAKFGEEATMRQIRKLQYSGRNEEAKRWKNALKLAKGRKLL